MPLHPPQWPTREEQIARLKKEPFDIMVIGGGATGTGIALDAATRGLSTALVERDDFSSGTSSRSTKLIHGGVRYLEQAVKHLDHAQYSLVKNALRERALVLKNAPHLAKSIKLLTPLYHWWQIPYYWIGLKIYDRLSGRRSLGTSCYLNKTETLKALPFLKASKLKGAVAYYDGQFDDARFNISLALTAASRGAAIANHTEVTELIKTDGRITGAKVQDSLTNEKWTINAKVVINATGPYVDLIRMTDDPHATPIVRPSEGTHLVIDGQITHPETGMLIPKTKDGRVLFLLPWQGALLAGTTDQEAQLSWDPKPTAQDVAYILEHLNHYIDTPINPKMVRSQWSGLRPLVCDPTVANTSKLVRDHYIEISPSGLLTISGGKWTTYRKMAEDAVDQAMASATIIGANPCVTPSYRLVGADQYRDDLWKDVQKKYHFDDAIAQHLTSAYGDRAEAVAQLAQQGYGKTLAEGHPYLEAEVVYAVNKEYARTPMDVLMRRTRLFHLDQSAAIAAVPRTTQLMAQQLAWSQLRQKTEQQQALDTLQTNKEPEPTRLP